MLVLPVVMPIDNKSNASNNNSSSINRNSSRKRIRTASAAAAAANVVVASTPTITTTTSPHPPTAAAAASHSRPRSSQPTTSTTATSNISLAATATTTTIPDPPPSLIALIQTEPLVHQYFQSLQQQLHNDVQQWKQRAQQWQQKNRLLVLQQQQQQLQLRQEIGGGGEVTVLPPPQSQQHDTTNTTHASITTPTAPTTTAGTAAPIAAKKLRAERIVNTNVDGTAFTTTTATTTTMNQQQQLPHATTTTTDNCSSGAPDIDDTILDDVFDNLSESTNESDDDNDKNEEEEIDDGTNNNKNNSYLSMTTKQSTRTATVRTKVATSKRIGAITNKNDDDDEDVDDTTTNHCNSTSTASATVTPTTSDIIALDHLKEAYTIFVFQLGIALCVNPTTTTKTTATTAVNHHHHHHLHDQSIIHTTVITTNDDTNADADDTDFSTEPPPPPPNDSTTTATTTTKKRKYIPVPIVTARTDAEIITDILRYIVHNTLIVKHNPLRQQQQSPLPADNQTTSDGLDDIELGSVECSNNSTSNSVVGGNGTRLGCNPLPPLESADTTTTTTTTTTAIDDPLLVGKRLLFRALVIIDTFCSSCISEKEWNDMFITPPTKENGCNFINNDNNNNNNEIDTSCLEFLTGIRIGFRSRKSLVDQLLHQHLIPDISYRWSCIDFNSNNIDINSSAQRYHINKDVSRHMHWNNNSNSNNPSHLDDGDTEHHNNTTMAVSKTSYLYGNRIERSILCQLTMGLLMLRNDIHSAVQVVCQYILSTTIKPTITCSNDDDCDEACRYPTNRLPPPLFSFVVLEGLLLLSDPTMVQQYITSDIGDTEDDDDEAAAALDATAQPTLWLDHHFTVVYGSRNVIIEQFYETLLQAMNNAASLWQPRTSSTNDSIHDIASIEMFSYRRLLHHVDGRRNRKIHTHIQTVNHLTNQIVQDKLNDMIKLNDMTSMLSTVSDLAENINSEVHYLPLQRAAIIGDNVPLLDRSIHTKLQEPLNERNVSTLCHLLRVVVPVKRQLELRQRDETVVAADVFSFASILKELFDKSLSLDVTQRLQILCTALECSVIAADARSAVLVVTQLLTALMQNENISKSSSWEMTNIRSIVSIVRRNSSYPVIRVINLERRKDRMKGFMVQALRERLLVVKAVTDLRRPDTTGDQMTDIEGYEFGCYAIDGHGRLVEATERLVQHFGSMDVVNKYVHPYWRPNDLKPFDTDAPNSEAKVVRISPSERACALSHISSWKGILRSLQSANMDTSFDAQMIRLYKISGYAQGPALLEQNRNLPPAPVCVILEDDAIVVDRFTDRLNELFREIPRDFHFCSLGYSRPKSAPIVPYSNHIGIPSMLWYLTGYCISEAGAQYLLDALPVVGPVDSWIGLQMTGNWDNTFGVRLGVGIHATKPNSSERPTTKELCQILKFRAYCALRPLCSQKVRVTTTASTLGTIVAPTENGRRRQWRQRDTDIEYSGGNVEIVEDKH